MQRDLYKFMHDQSLRLLNHGFTPRDRRGVALPAGLEQEWSARGYYGTLAITPRRSTRSTSAGTMPIRPTSIRCRRSRRAQDGRVYGRRRCRIVRARADFAKGNYRWVASAMNHVVFADPANRAARELGADAMEQMGYQAESGPWRDAYLVGAAELRNGAPKIPDKAPPMPTPSRRSTPACSSITSAPGSTPPRPRARA